MLLSVILLSSMFTITMPRAVAGATSTDSIISTVKVGFDPGAMAYSNSTGYTYVVNFGCAECPGTISVLSGSSFKTNVTITGFVEPDAIAYNPSNNQFYVPNEVDGSHNSSTVNIISGGAAPNVTATTTVGYGPADVAYDPSNNLMYVVNWADYTLSLISGDQTTNTFNLGCNPFNIAYDPANQDMYQSCIQPANSQAGAGLGNAFLRVISGTTIRPDNITLGPGAAYNLVYDPSNHEMFAASVDGGEILAINGTHIVGNTTFTETSQPRLILSCTIPPIRTSTSSKTIPATTQPASLSSRAATSLSVMSQSERGHRTWPTTRSTMPSTSQTMKTRSIQARSTRSAEHPLSRT